MVISTKQKERRLTRDMKNCLETDQDLIDTKINSIVLKAHNYLAPEYFSELFIRNSDLLKDES